MFLVRHGGTAATRAGRLPLDEPAEHAPQLPPRAEVRTSPALRCQVDGATVEPGLGPWDLGRWAGRSFGELFVEDAEAALTWRSDPSWAGHGGESLAQLSLRVGALLGRWHGNPGRLVAVTHGAVIQCAVAHALRMPLLSVWDLDVSPGSLTELHARAGGWRVSRVNARPGTASAD